MSLNANYCNSQQYQENRQLVSTEVVGVEPSLSGAVWKDAGWVLKGPLVCLPLPSAPSLAEVKKGWVASSRVVSSEGEGV